MSKQLFASTIISKMKAMVPPDPSAYNASTPVLANTAIALGITEYLMTNTMISIAYAGTIPGVPPIPVATTDMVGVVGSCLPLAGADFNSWVKSIELGIMGGFMLAPGKAGVLPLGSLPAFTIPGLIILQPQLKAAADANEKAPQQAVWEAICDGILMWLENMATVPTYPASFTGSTGVATKVKTTII